MSKELTAVFRQAKTLQASLLEIVDRVEAVKSEHEKLDSGNRFLQSSATLSVLRVSTLSC